MHAAVPVPLHYQMRQTCVPTGLDSVEHGEPGLAYGKTYREGLYLISPLQKDYCIPFYPYDRDTLE